MVCCFVIKNALAGHNNRNPFHTHHKYMANHDRDRKHTTDAQTLGYEPADQAEAEVIDTHTLCVFAIIDEM